MNRKNQVTLEFKTKAERDLWAKWYARQGANQFFGLMASYGPNWSKTKTGLKWRRYAEKKLKNWPADNEKFV